MKYPAILRLSNDCVVLATSLGCGFALKDYRDEYESTYANKFYKDFHGFESATNITPEFLQNTWGVVESKEHAEFIVELASLAGFFIACDYSDSIKFFCTNNESLVFCRAEQNAKRERKQITIPLPPKQIQTATPEEEFEMTQIMKNAGDNLVLGCEDSKCDEWPKTGDEVEFPTGRGVLIVSKPDEQGVVIVESLDEDFGNVYKRVSLKAIKKPKTPEEELRDELTESFCAVGYETGKYIDHLMDKYNITKKPQ